MPAQTFDYHQLTMAESECAVYKKLKERETRAHSVWTSFLFRNEVKPGFRPRQSESIRRKKWKRIRRHTKRG